MRVVLSMARQRQRKAMAMSGRTKIFLATGITVFVGSLALGMPVADAAEPKVDCSNARSTAEMNHCTGLELQAADRDLNRVYQRAIAKRRKDGDAGPYTFDAWHAALKASQRAWIKYRDADCDGVVVQDWGGGSGTSSAVNVCRTGLTRHRTAILKERYGIK